jgi:hypothetical protein
MDTKPDLVWVLAGAEVLGFTSAMQAAGYTGQMANSAYYSPGLLTKFKSISDLLNGTLVHAAIPVLEAGSPFVKQMAKDYQAIGKTQLSDITFGGEFAYEAADLMIATMKKVAPNFDKLVPTISKGFSYKPAKDGNPLTWPAAYNESPKCTSVVRISNGAYQIATPFNCNGKRVKVSG